MADIGEPLRRIEVLPTTAPVLPPTEAPTPAPPEPAVAAPRTGDSAAGLVGKDEPQPAEVRVAGFTGHGHLPADPQSRQSWRRVEEVERISTTARC
jgi:hypothetical protein